MAAYTQFRSMSAESQQKVIGLEFERVEWLIRSLAGRYKRRYGGEYGEHFANASLYFVEAYYDFDPNHGTEFEHWIQFKVWRRMVEDIRRTLRRRETAPINLTEHPDEFLDVVASRPRQFLMVEFMDQLTDEAREVVRLLLSPPAALQARYGMTNEAGKTEVAEVLTAYICQRDNVTPTAVRLSFAEVESVVVM